MIRLRSLRSRLLLGAILWTFGLLTLAAFGGIHGLLRYEHLHMVVYTAVLQHVVLFLGVAIACLVAGLVQVRRGLSGVDRLYDRLSDVRHGRARRLDGVYATEVQPLVDDLNALLDHRERTVARALAKAGDLAHGLKTPLAILAHEATRARAAGHADVAAAVDQQVERMQRQMDYHLAQARAAASGSTPGARCLVADSVGGLTRALTRLHAERGITIDVQVAPTHAVRVEREDLDEMLGNLLDNACKWARTKIVVASSASDAHIVVTVDDDGPGLDAAARVVALQRGVRLDESGPGHGLGLAIVRDLAELYGGTIALSMSASGGLRASLRLPDADRQA